MLSCPFPCLAELTAWCADQVFLGRSCLNELMELAENMDYPEVQAFASRIILNMKRHPSNITLIYVCVACTVPFFVLFRTVKAAVSVLTIWVLQRNHLVWLWQT